MANRGTFTRSRISLACVSLLALLSTGPALLAGLLAAPAAWAQSAPAAAPGLDGAWSTSVKVPATGREFHGTASIAGAEGSWQFAVKNPNDPCVGLRVPLSLRPVEGDGVEFKVLTSKALTGCADSSVVFKAVDANTWHGVNSNGLPVTLKRRP